MGRERYALLAEEPTAYFLFLTKKEAALLLTVSPVYTHRMSHFATICQVITKCCVIMAQREIGRLDSCAANTLQLIKLTRSHINECARGRWK